MPPRLANTMNNHAAHTDEELALAYSRGDNRAFDELLARNQSRLFSYILFVVHNEDTANDLFQETFVKVITKLQNGHYTDSGRFSAWITRIAHNVIMDWYRDEHARGIVDAGTDGDLSRLCTTGVFSPSRESRYVKEQALADARRIMDSLPPTQREVVYMRYYQNLSFKEISKLTGTSINTALGRMRYALFNMRRMAKRNGVALQLD